MPKRPNHAAEIMQHKQNRSDAGLMSELFPNVSDMVVRMEYYGQGATPLIMTRTVNFSQSEHAYFHMGCMTNGCQNGGFDLTKIITGMIKARRQSEKGKLSCQGKGKDIDPGHISINYEISIKFKKIKS